MTVGHGTPDRHDGKPSEQPVAPPQMVLDQTQSGEPNTKTSAHAREISQIAEMNAAHPDQATLADHNAHACAVGLSWAGHQIHRLQTDVAVALPANETRRDCPSDVETSSTDMLDTFFMRSGLDRECATFVGSNRERRRDRSKESPV